YKKIAFAGILTGTILIICQLVLVFIGNMVSTDTVISSTAKTLQSSLNHEIVHNINDRLNSMKSLGERISADETFTSYDRTESSLPVPERAAKENALGTDLSKYYTVGDFSDCVVIFKDNSTLGILDTATQNLFGDSIYKFFAGQADESLDSSKFSTGYDTDFSHIYFSQRVNPNTVFMVSVLRESFDSLFYDAEENASMTLRLVSAYDGILYSSDKADEIGSALDTDLSQAVSNSDHLSMILKGRVIASDSCINKWKVISTIPLSDLEGESASLKTVYLLISLTIILIAIISIIIYMVRLKKRIKTLDEIEQTLSDYEDYNNINLN
nr:hypothetical protein [Eubacterium sp.]